MALGLTREQIGVTEAMIASYGEAVFRMSHNLQLRAGDPIRRLDWPEIERQREAMGLNDAQIAERLGLTREQAMFIRNTEESRRFRAGQTAYLLDLGGGRRYRQERVVRLEERGRYSEAALRLRESMKFDAERACEYLRRGWWRADTLPAWLARHEAERPDAPALVHAGVTISWRELAQRVARFAEGLRRAGVARGDVVAVQLPNIPEFAIACLAICRLGAVMGTVHMNYREAEIASIVRHGGARAAVCVALSKDWSAAAAFRNVLDIVVAVGEGAGDALSFAALEASPPLSKDVPGPVAADPFLLLYTSGTTAAPKAVPQNYHTMLSNARLGAPEHGLDASDRILSAAPFTHLFGLYALHCAWAVGAASVLLPAFTPPDLAATIERDKPTALWTAPAHIAASRAMGLLDRHDWGSLKLAIMSGSACPPELVRDLAARLPGCAVTQLWGMTELQAGLYTRPGEPLEVHATSTGRPSPGTEVRVGEDGELQVRGCLMFPGYYGNDEANRAAFTPDGWFRTGDLASIDAAGNVSITGRSKDVINRGGVKFNPRDVEDLLAAHPQVLMAAMVPMPDPVLGERACVFVQLRPGATAPTLEELVAWLLERRIAKVKLPERLVVVDEMPLTPTRKIIKGRLRIPA
ncbi:MAG: AMP-binding protein [Burkholderiales bacterium]